MVQKLFRFARGTAIGFVGDLHFASQMLVWGFIQLQCRTPKDPFSLRLWLPRLFRAAYRKLEARARRHPPVAFMVGSSVQGRPNVVERADAARLFTKIAERNSQGGSNNGRLLFHLLQ